MYICVFRKIKENKIMEIFIANIINFISGMCSILSTQGKDKRQIVFIEFIGSILRILQAALVKSWSDAIAKAIKILAQVLSLKDKLAKKGFYILSIGYILVCISITYISKDLRCLVAIIPSVMEFYALLQPSTVKYRWYIIITKV